MATSDLLDLRLIGAITLVLRNSWPHREYSDLHQLMASLPRRLPTAGQSSKHYEAKAVVRHLVYMEAMGVVIRITGEKRLNSWRKTYWRLSRQHELKAHLEHTGEASQRNRDEDFAHVEALNASADGGNRGSDGNSGGGGEGGEGPHDGDGNGGGMREILAHPVLFALPRSEFQSLINGLFIQDGAA